jgi:hypothetical protein
MLRFLRTITFHLNKWIHVRREAPDHAEEEVVSTVAVHLENTLTIQIFLTTAGWGHIKLTYVVNE